ncbi:hypothetical protein [Pseudoxanthomonas indica]|nr:hypothetical protein [Pseudoxanthomonas indica]
MKQYTLLASAVLMMSACATQHYPTSSPMVRVGPSKMWHKSGASGKEAWETWQKCIEIPGNKKVTDACMKERGFKYGRTDDVYIPPRAPERDWVCTKPGLACAGLFYGESVRLQRQCYEEADEQTPEYQEARKNRRLSEYGQTIVNECMAANGFTYEVVEGQP